MPTGKFRVNIITQTHKGYSENYLVVINYCYIFSKIF